MLQWKLPAKDDKKMGTTDSKIRVHSFDEARGYAARALALADQHRLAASPSNYAVLYAYCAGEHPELREAFDAAVRSGSPLDEFVLRELHERFVAFDQIKSLQGVGTDLQKIVQTLLGNIGEAGQDAQEFGRTLETALGRLRDDSGPQAVQAVAATMLTATRQAKQRNEHLHKRLESTLAEAEVLRSELEEQRRAALMDPLTGLLNRRAMEAQFGELMAVDANAPLSVLMVDIDHFKRINDTHGHALGDAVIRNVADVIRKSLRANQHAVRYGGEEFVVLLPQTPLDGAERIAEQIRARIAALRLVRKRDNFTLEPFTASLGVATRRAGDTKDTLLSRADSALYRAKGGGRNRVTVETVH